MGIILVNSALRDAIAAARSNGVAPAIKIEYAPSYDARSGSTFLQNAQQLVGFIGEAGWPKERAIRVQWAASPQPPRSLVNEVNTALSNARNVMGDLGALVSQNSRNTQNNMSARAFTGGSGLQGQQGTSLGMMVHEAAHVVQQRRGSGNQ